MSNKKNKRFSSEPSVFNFKGSAYTSPCVKEMSKGGIEFVDYGLDNTTDKLYKNNYFKYLGDRALYSNTNKTVIESIASLIVGKGIDALDSSKNPKHYAVLKSFDLDEDLYKLAYDRKTFGMGALMVTKTKGTVTNIQHWAMETLRSGIQNEDGEVEQWFYHHDWSAKKYGEDADDVFPAFGFGGDSSNEIYIIKSYTPFFSYYSPADWTGALPYCVAEEEVGDFLVNEVKNSFSGTKMVTFSDGKPTEENAKKISRETKNTMTGSTGSKVIVSFVNGQENAPVVENLDLSDAPDHYTYLSQESENKILKAHRAPTWLLGANSGGNGLSSNADEIKNSMLVFDNFVIKPYQNEILKAINDILSLNGVSLKLYFKTIQPLEFIDLDNVSDSETKEEETGVKQEMSKHDQSALEAFIDEYGEDAPEGYDLVDSREVDLENEDELDRIVRELNDKALEASGKKSSFSKLISFLSTGTARPNRESEQDKVVDGSLYKVRYRYTGDTSAKSRPFCLLMSVRNKLYRKEDIVRMENKPVNKGWGAGGADTYSVWLYKGGGGCFHRWTRETYKLKGKTKGSIYGANSEQISTAQGEREGYRVRNPKEVAMKPKDMPNNGFLN